MDRDDDSPIRSGVEGIYAVPGGGLTPDLSYRVAARPGVGVAPWKMA